MKQHSRPALPEKWITPIRLAVVLVLAACSAFIFFNVKELKFTHYIILMTIALVCSMAWLDCKMSLRYWQEQAAKPDAKPASKSGAKPTSDASS